MEPAPVHKRAGSLERADARALRSHTGTHMLGATSAHAGVCARVCKCAEACLRLGACGCWAPQGRPVSLIAERSPQSRCRCGRGEPQSRCRCGRGEPRGQPVNRRAQSAPVEVVNRQVVGQCIPEPHPPAPSPVLTKSKCPSCSAGRRALLARQLMPRVTLHVARHVSVV